jgi:DNA polymerase III epsilon subunit-like protein
MKFIFLDTETTGLDIDRHEVWEFGAVVLPDGLDSEPYEVEMKWEALWLEQADPQALRINRYYERTADLDKLGFASDAARIIALLCDDAFLIGRNPYFDKEFLTKLCRENSLCFTPRHPVLNIVDLTLGWLWSRGQNLELPHRGSDIMDAIGFDPDPAVAHTALGDARAVYDAFVWLREEVGA